MLQSQEIASTDRMAPMNDTQVQEPHWHTALELPQQIFEVWRKPDGALNPVALVATVDLDGSPHTAPFGSVRATTPRLLGLVTFHGHDTYANLCRDRRIMVSLLAPPTIAVSVRGKSNKRAHECRFQLCTCGN